MGSRIQFVKPPGEVCETAQTSVDKKGVEITETMWNPDFTQLSLLVFIDFIQ